MDIIDIAKEYCVSRQVVGNKTVLITFRSQQLQQFAQRIEQPHLQRIAELEQQVKQLREALRKAANQLTESGWNCGNLFEEIDNVLEQTK